jgi:hypothetical protein
MWWRAPEDRGGAAFLEPRVVFLQSSFWIFWSWEPMALLPESSVPFSLCDAGKSIFDIHNTVSTPDSLFQFCIERY